MKYIKFKILLLILLSFIFVGNSKAQMAIASGSSIDVPVQNSYEVLDISVDADIKDQVAEVTVSQTIYNPNNRSLEVEIFFPLPAKGAVQNLILMVDGKEIAGQLLEKSEATKIYEGIVNRKRDPALMEYVGYGLYKTKVFPIGIREKREISVSYTIVLERKLDLATFTYPFGTQKFSAKALQSVNLNARIKTTTALKNIYSPSDEVDVTKINDHSAVVTMKMVNKIPDHDFKLNYSISDEKFGISVLSYKPKESENGYFMLLASPSMDEDKTATISKNVVFVIDKSGSMAGNKITQACSALNFVLGNLNENDNFNIIAYSNRVELFSENLVSYSDKTYLEAKTYVNSITSGGGTNINDALTSAVKFFTDKSKPNYIVFLTDGLPTIGIVSEMEISQNCKSNNLNKARIFSLGVGYDVNARLLDRLSDQNSGVSEYVKPNENIETAMGDLYNNISAPVLTDISIRIDGTRITETYPSDIPDLFKGKQLVWLGRYSKAVETQVVISGNINGKSTVFENEIVLNDHKSGSEYEYIEKIWATRKIGYLIDQIDLYGNKDELVNELVALSKTYGVLTPYTSFLAREDIDFNDGEVVFENTRKNLMELDKVSGISGNSQRASKAEFKSNSIVTSEVVEYDMEGNKEVSKTIKNIGTSTFFWRNEQWVESSVTEAEEKNAIEIKQFSDDYYNLARSGNTKINQYLSNNEKIVFKENGKVYLIF